MDTAEEGPGAESTATTVDAADYGDLPKTDDSGEATATATATAVDANDGLSADFLRIADAEHHVDDKEEEGGEIDESQNTGGGGLLRRWDFSRDFVTPTSPIDNTKSVDESHHEHNFEPGDHIIRWDMLPILWPIQIHGIVLEVSNDKSEVTICDFGITSAKNDDEDEKVDESQMGHDENNMEEENAKFNEAIQDQCCDGLPESSDLSTTKKETDEKKNEAIQDECQDAKNVDLSGSTEAPTTKKSRKKMQRLNVIKLTKWSDLRKWHKVNYEGGLLNVGKGGVGKGLKNLGKKTEKLWSSMTKSFVKNDVVLKNNKKVWRSVRYDVDEKGMCVHHPDIQLRRLKDGEDWAVVRKKCPDCIMEDCPAMMGEESPKSKESLLESSSSYLSAEDGHSVSQSKTATPEETPLEESNKPDEIKPCPTPVASSLQSSVNSNNESPSSSRLGEAEEEVIADSAGKDLAKSESDNVDVAPKSLAEMIAEANEIERRSRNALNMKWKSKGNERKPWHGSFMNSLSNIFPQKNKGGALTNMDSNSEKKETISLPGDNGKETTNSEKQPNSLEDLPRSDPPILVLARTRFILEHGESVLPPYHIVNSNSECIAVWCKTGRWSTLQASVFLHSTAIGNAKSATALTLGVAATQPWLIPVFATVGLAAVGTPWLLLKVANTQWNEATTSLTEKFWIQAKPEVFVECIEIWGNIK